VYPPPTSERRWGLCLAGTYGRTDGWTDSSRLPTRPTCSIYNLSGHSRPCRSVLAGLEPKDKHSDGTSVSFMARTYPFHPSRIEKRSRSAHRSRKVRKLAGSLLRCYRSWRIISSASRLRQSSEMRGAIERSTVSHPKQTREWS